MNYDTGIDLEKSTAFLHERCNQGDIVARAFWEHRRNWALGAKQSLDKLPAMIVHCLCISGEPIATYRDWKENLATDFRMFHIETALADLIETHWISERKMGKMGKWWQINCDFLAVAEHLLQSIHTYDKGDVDPWKIPIWGPWWTDVADYTNLPFAAIVKGSEPHSETLA